MNRRLPQDDCISAFLEHQFSSHDEKNEIRFYGALDWDDETHRKGRQAVQILVPTTQLVYKIRRWCPDGRGSLVFGDT